MSLMINQIELNYYSVLIHQRLDGLIKENLLGVGAQRFVELDTQFIRRLSRMDVLQSEAMVRVQQCLLDGRRQALLQALGCIEAGEFGDGVDNGN